MEFEARFKGIKKTIKIPLDSLLWIYSRDIDYGLGINNLKKIMV
jgi:stringent starvation protein B